MVEVQTILKQPLNLIFIAYVLVLISFIFMIKSSYDMKGGYDYGAGLQAQCDTLFMERERADFHANTTYKKTVKSQFKTAYSYLLSVSVLIVMISYSLWIVFAFIGDVSNGPGGDSTNTYLYNFTKTLQWSSLTSKLFLILQRFIFPGTVLATMGYLMSIWIKGNFTTSGVKIGNKRVQLSPFNDAVYRSGGRYTGGALLLRTHYKYLTIIFGSMIVGSMLYNPTILNGTFGSITPISSTYTGHILALYVVLMIILPLFVDIIASFQDAHITYNDNTTLLNQAITAVVDDTSSANAAKNTSLVLELEKNIMKSDPKRFVEGGGAPTLSDYNNILYQYVMHVTNDTDVTGIAVPQELKTIIRPIYLTGEQTIVLKRKLVDVFNRHHWAGTTITKATLDTSTGSSRKLATDKDLLPFLIPDVTFKMATDDRRDDTTREKYLGLLNAYIVNNITLKHGNPLPDPIITLMTTMRRDMSMKTVVNNYFTKVNFLIMSMIIGYAYYVYHNLYRSQPEGTVQKVSLLAFVLLVLLGFAGWFTKELWI